MQAVDLIFSLAILLMSAVIHEVSHGYAAYLLGDPTAKNAGRLTLNPVKHLDFFGSIILPFLLVLTGSPFVFGWAKPVPYNPYNLKNQKWGSAIVGAAGPLSNIFMALVFGLILRFGVDSHFISSSFLDIIASIVFINLLLAVFNLVPVPPLDGSKLLFSVLPYNWRRAEYFLERYGIFFLLFFIFFLWRFLLPIIALLFRLITGVGL